MGAYPGHGFHLKGVDAEKQCGGKGQKPGSAYLEHKKADQPDVEKMENDVDPMITLRLYPKEMILKRAAEQGDRVIIGEYKRRKDFLNTVGREFMNHRILGDIHAVVPVCEFKMTRG